MPQHKSQLGHSLSLLAQFQQGSLSRRRVQKLDNPLHSLAVVLAHALVFAGGYASPVLGTSGTGRIVCRGCARVADGSQPVVLLDGCVVLLLLLLLLLLLVLGMVLMHLKGERVMLLMRKRVVLQHRERPTVSVPDCWVRYDRYEEVNRWTWLSLLRELRLMLMWGRSCLELKRPLPRIGIAA